MGDALMGTGSAEGENRAMIAADSAIHSPMLDDISIVGAKGILINITGGDDMTLYDVNDATQNIYDAVGDNVETNIIFGAVTDPLMKGKIRVTVIATGFNEDKMEKKREFRGIKPVGNMPGKKSADAQAEQMSFSLQSPTHPVHKEEIRPLGQDGAFSEAAVEDVHIVAEVVEETQKAVASALTNAPASGPLDFPTFIKKDKMKKDAQFVVTKGNIIEHYADDMDIPTFLRKQMQ